MLRELSKCELAIVSGGRTDVYPELPPYGYTLVGWSEETVGYDKVCNFWECIKYPIVEVTPIYIPTGALYYPGTTVMY